LDDAVSALGQVAGLRAGPVFGVFFAQVAVFIKLDNPITAAGFFACGAAKPARVVIFALVALFGVKVDHTIPAQFFFEAIKVPFVIRDFRSAGEERCKS